jgi:prepilin-type N-terminal cleavage/methylation domain-containing protein
MYKGARAFTLIELLVVIAIIGILASITLTLFGSTRVNARDAKRISELRQIRNALDIYFVSNGFYPCAIYTGGTCTNTLQNSTAMPTPPKDPLGASYTYAGLGSGTCTTYHLGASLEGKTNQILKGDADAAAGTACANSAADFSGLAFAAGGSACSGSAGTAQPTANANGESCYDLLNP